MRFQPNILVKQIEPRRDLLWSFLLELRSGDFLFRMRSGSPFFNLLMHLKCAPAPHKWSFSVLLNDANSVQKAHVVVHEWNPNYLTTGFVSTILLSAGAAILSWNLELALCEFRLLVVFE